MFPNFEVLDLVVELVPGQVKAEKQETKANNRTMGAKELKTA